MTSTPTRTAAVIGGGPAGLMAAERLASAGLAVTVFDRMPSVGRKLLMAGRGGLNITHSEPLDRFLSRYGPARARLEPALRALPPEAVTAWCEGLGQPTFVGSSGRVFPTALKASPLLRAWLTRLQSLDVRFVPRAQWAGWDDTGALRFADGATLSPDLTVLALGGGSWPRLGSDGAWTAHFDPGDLRPLRPSNCGFAVPWSDIFRQRFEGQPLKRIALSFGDTTVRGEAMVTAAGIEGGAVYALSARLRDAIAAQGPITLRIDLRPDLTHADLARRLAAPRGSRSLSSFLRKEAALPPIAIGLLQEARHAGDDSPLPDLVKATPIRLTAPFPLARAISSAGGVALDAVDDRFMLKRRPGTFLAGEMLDWEAPTGGYLLQACLSTAAFAANGALAWLAEQ